jgi:transcriptional regulator with GAF, ATPase, and Fis domain
MWNSLEASLNQRRVEGVFLKAGLRQSLFAAQILSSVRRGVEPSSPGERGARRARHENGSDPVQLRSIALAELSEPEILSGATGEGANSRPTTLKDAEREHILQALAETNWVIECIKGAAARLGLKRTTLISKMQKLAISRAMA